MLQMRGLGLWVVSVVTVAFGGGATCAAEMQRDPDALAPMPVFSRTFIAPGVQKDIVASDGTTWQLSAQESITAIGQSADLWITHVSADGTAEAPVFLGAAPSCYGRALWRDSSDGKDRTSLCYLSSFAIRGADVEIRMHLGGGWEHTLTIPLEAATRDTDGDKWSDALETLLGTDPQNADTDGDTLPDNEDPNPMTIPSLPVAENPRQQDLRELVALATADVPGCLKGKPMIIIAPVEALQSLPPRDCQQIMLPPTAPAARWRSALLPLNGKMPAQNPHTLDEAARAGGIARVLVQVHSLSKSSAVIDVVVIAGTIRRQLDKRGNRWVSLERSFLPADGWAP